VRIIEFGFQNLCKIHKAKFCLYGIRKYQITHEKMLEEERTTPKEILGLFRKKTEMDLEMDGNIMH
jgi:hypothetical protein